MTTGRRITANLPEGLLEEAMEVTGKGITETEHWIRVGDLRRRLAGRGVSVSTPDAHVAQCALEREALLLTRDSVFLRIAQTSELRVQPG